MNMTRDSEEFSLDGPDDRLVRELYQYHSRTRFRGPVAFFHDAVARSSTGEPSRPKAGRSAP